MKEVKQGHSAHCLRNFMVNDQDTLKSTDGVPFD